MIRHARARAGHPSLSLSMLQGVDGRDKPGRDKADVARIKCFGMVAYSKNPESKSPRPVSGAGLILAMLNICR
jgi:hypothetical protein